jgi:hypothetical protein
MAATNLFYRWDFWLRLATLTVAAGFVLPTIGFRIGQANSEATTAMIQIQDAVEGVAKLIKEYEPSNDRLILKCLRTQLAELQVLHTAALATSAKIIASQGGELKASAISALFEQQQLADELYDKAKSCLRIQSGDIVTYGADTPLPISPLPPNVPTPGSNLNQQPDPAEQLPDLESEPTDEPVSNVEVP